MIIEELAAGILQITHRGTLTPADWQEAVSEINVYLRTHADPVYLLLNIAGTTQVDDNTFRELVTTPHYNDDGVGMAILVGRRAQLQQARDVVGGQDTKLRLFPQLDNAIRTLLDRQVIDRIEAQQRYGDG